MAILEEAVPMAEPTAKSGVIYDIYNVGCMTNKDRWNFYVPVECQKKVKDSLEVHKILTRTRIDWFIYPEVGSWEGAQFSWAVWTTDKKGVPLDPVGIIIKFPTNLDIRSTIDDINEGKKKIHSYLYKSQFTSHPECVLARKNEDEYVDAIDEAQAKDGEEFIPLPCKEVFDKQKLYDMGLAS